MSTQLRALVRKPSGRLSEGITTHIERVPLDVDLARTQWEAYVAALTSAGWAMVEVSPIEQCPDSVFVEDTVVMFGAVAVLTRPGADSRRGEVAGTAEALEALGYRTARITGDGRLDGGDVLKVGSRVYVGRGGRTNAEGIRQLRAVLTPLGAQVTAVPLTKALHLKSAVTALPDGTVIGWEPVVDDPAFFPHFLAMPEETGRACRRPRRRQVADLGRCSQVGRHHRRPRLYAGAGRHLRVREARGLRDLSFRAAASRPVGRPGHTVRARAETPMAASST